MNPIVRYTLLFMIWFGTVFGFYLHNKPAESIEPVQPPEPLVQIRESETQNATLNLLKAKVTRLESEIETNTQLLRTYEANIDELENQKPKHAQKIKTSKAKTESQKPAKTAAQPVQRVPNRFNTPINGRPARTNAGTQRRPANTSAIPTFSANSMKSYLNEAANRARRCNGRGNLQIRLTVGNNGRVSSVSAVSGNLKGTATERCIVNEFKNQSFPKFQRPAYINTTYNVRL